MSDHKPKKLVVDVSKRKWRRAFEPKRVPRVRWKALKIEAVEKRFLETAQRKIGEMGDGREDSTRWTEIAENLVQAAKETCGEQPKSVENEWLKNKDEDQRLRRDITAKLEKKNEAQERQREGEENDEEVEERKEELKTARKTRKKERKRWEKEWWEEILVQCERAAGRADQGAMYKALNQLGKRGVKKVSATNTITKEDFKDHFSKVSADRFENSPEEIEAAVEQAEDLRGDPRMAGWRVRLNTRPDREEIVKQMRAMRDGAPGEDGARMRYIMSAGQKTEEAVVEMVQFMWRNSAEKWEDSLKRGLIVPLYKGKGDRNSPNNYCGVCLLSMGRRIVARIVSVRINEWSEDMGLLDDNQAGFRRGRSTADATQIMMRLQEDGVDLRKRGGAGRRFCPFGPLAGFEKSLSAGEQGCAVAAVETIWSRGRLFEATSGSTRDN